MCGSQPTFLDLCLGGQVSPSDVETFIEAWHEADTDQPVWTFLGLSEADYLQWLEEPASLHRLVQDRRRRAA